MKVVRSLFYVLIHPVTYDKRKFISEDRNFDLDTRKSIPDKFYFHCYSTEKNQSHNQVYLVSHTNAMRYQNYRSWRIVAYY